MAAFAQRANANNIDPNPHPVLQSAASFPALQPRPKPTGLAARRPRPNFSLRDIDAVVLPDGPAAAGLGAGRPTFQEPPRRPPAGNFGSPFSNFSKIVDPSGALNFNGKAILHAAGVNFSSGASFTINMDQLQLDEELGRGNYGTVKKVLHKPTNVAMAMKAPFSSLLHSLLRLTFFLLQEIRLELEDAKLNAIIMELDVLHRAVAPEIVEFYGAFFIESCVYYCMEYMDAGSLDKLQSAGVPEDVLARIASSMVRGLKFLKDDLNIIHRDVKPTNVLVNKKGEIKLCDFGISGELDKSLAKTNIGCQSYMAPERIKGESQNNLGTYTVSSDVWSLGLSMIEIGMGKYPYPPETYSNVFAQLTAIVHGDPPELPEDKYSQEARDWVTQCLKKDPERRATYRELLEHPFLVKDRTSNVDMIRWVEKALEHRVAIALAAVKTQPPQSV
ncbi:kinase-like protein [Gymnopilus junonius]|uniref:mitogen-activated protein kinase kinase n=1 Tax=Gymnopilus junonius TaxID=109634 RepID=A0A9P5NUJ0_GYMJU|nr:kinase-like protein [Gymnopilus junonius]